MDEKALKYMREKVIAILRDKLSLKEEDEITDDSNLKDDLGADSLDSVELLMAIEEEFKEFKIEISDGEAEKIEYVKDIYAIIEANAS